MYLWGASERKLGKSLKTNQKEIGKIKGKGLSTQPQKKPHHNSIRVRVTQLYPPARAVEL
jgi:hypothetical protein